MTKGERQKVLDECEKIYNESKLSTLCQFQNFLLWLITPNPQTALALGEDGAAAAMRSNNLIF